MVIFVANKTFLHVNIIIRHKYTQVWFCNINS